MKYLLINLYNMLKKKILWYRNKIYANLYDRFFLNMSLFNYIRVSPRTVYVDSSKPKLVEGFTKKTFIAMIEGIRGLHRTTTEGMAFSVTRFLKPSPKNHR